MVTGLHNSQHRIFGAGFGNRGLGFEQLYNSGNFYRFGFNTIRIHDNGADDHRVLVFKDGEFSQAPFLSRGQLDLNIDDVVFRLDSLTIPATNIVPSHLLDLYSCNLEHLRNGTDVRITWSASIAADLAYTEIYCDLGNSGLSAAEFDRIAVVYNRNSQQYIHRPALLSSATTFRYFIRFVDLYGNGGPAFGSVLISSITLQPPPTLEGEFSFFTLGDNSVYGKFTTSGSTNVNEVLVFMNFIPGRGVVDYIQTVYPFALGDVNFELPRGTLKLYAIGFDEYGVPSVPIADSVTVVNNGSTDIYFDELTLADDFSVETIAAGLFNLSFTDPGGSWDAVNWQILDNATDMNEQASDVESKPTSSSPYTIEIDPNLDDGSYVIRFRMQKTVSGNTYYTDWSPVQTLLIDSTYPSGSTAISLEAL